MLWQSPQIPRVQKNEVELKIIHTNTKNKLVVEWFTYSFTNIATPVMRIAVGIKDIAYPNSLGIENFGRPCGISPT